ncbi:MAG: hypothetical protein AVDCRST_MAG55-3083, partial [uncultured Rubrobacteraceae bacterium]
AGRFASSGALRRQPALRRRIGRRGVAAAARPRPLREEGHLGPGGPPRRGDGTRGRPSAEV